MCKDFCHLHLHTDYSLLDGACQISRLADMAAEMKMPAMAITDHGNMHGAVEFYMALKKNDVKPVFGCEFYMAPDSRLVKNQNNPNFKGFHQIIYAKNQQGYQNLCRLNATAHMDGFYYNPRIDKEVLEQHKEGLVATSTCLGSEVNYYLVVENDINKAKGCIDDFVQILGKENYFLELQDHGIPEQRKANKHLIDFSKEFDIPLIATNDSHYLCKEHAQPHDALLCIGTGKNLADDNRLKFTGEEFYIKTQEEMAAIFQEVPESLSNTKEIFHFLLSLRLFENWSNSSWQKKKKN